MPRRKRTKKQSGSVKPPPPATTAPTGWGDLPNELLTKIFNELKIEVNENGKPKSREEKQALLNCRLMSRRWKDVTDDVLKKQCIGFWKIWRPHLAQQETTGSPHCFAVVHFKSTSAGDSTRLIQIHCPAFLQTGMKMLEKSPSPTNSVCVTQKPRGQRSHKNWILLTGVDVFAKFGQHLTTITFFNIDRIGIRTFSRILSHAPNMQAMTLQRIKMPVLEPGTWDVTLPSLPKLAHLKLLKIEWLDYRRNRLKADLNLRILDAYKQRLETLETDCWYKDENVDTENFPILKQLKIFMEDMGFSALQLPLVRQLCLMNLPSQDMDLIKELPYFLNKSSRTLVQLHVQLDPDLAFPATVKPAHDNWNCPTLPNVKSFAVTYPNCAEGLEAVQRLLKMLPNLEELKFIQFDETGDTEEDNDTVKTHLLEAHYWTVCKKLGVISVSMDADSSNPFYIRRAPFPK